jgi:hypothetical protein
MINNYSSKKRKRFSWICDFYKEYFNCVLDSLKIKEEKDGSDIKRWVNITLKKRNKNYFQDLIFNITKEQFNLLKNKLGYGGKNEIVDWFNYLYCMEKQVWSSNKYNEVIEVGNPILAFYCLEIAASILLDKNPEKENLSHRQVRKQLKDEFEKLGWNQLIFPFSLRRFKDKWEPSNFSNESKKYSRIESSYWGSRGRKFIELYKHWEARDKDTKIKIKEIKPDFYVYFYDMFYKYSETFRYRPIIPEFKYIQEFNFYTRAIFSIILTFFEVLIAIKFPEQAVSLFSENLKYPQKYMSSQLTRWNFLKDRLTKLLNQ